MDVYNDVVEAINSITQGVDVEKVLKQNFEGANLHRLTQRYKNYTKEIRSKIANKNQNDLRYYLLFFLLQNDIIEMLSNMWIKTPDLNNKRRINATIKLYRNSLQSMIDIYSIFETGSLTLFYPAWRTIYENYVISMFLIERDEEISLRFNEHILMDKLRIKAYKMSDLELKKANKLMEKYGKHYKEVYGWAYKDNETKIANFNQIRRKVKEKEFYEHYKLACEIMHASSLSVNQSIFNEEKLGNIEMIGLFSDDIKDLCIMVIGIVRKFTDLMVSTFLIEEIAAEFRSVNVIIGDYILYKEYDKKK